MKESEGLLLVQLGSPAELSEESSAEYLYEFLGDWHTLGKKLFFWKFLLKHIILPKGKITSFKKYQKMFAANGFTEMPLVTHSNQFLQAVKKLLPGSSIKLAYQYGCKPSIADALHEFEAEGIDTVNVLPLYPQRAGVTTQAANDKAIETAAKINFKGRLRTTEGFCYNAAWIREVANSIKPYLSADDTLIISWHGLQTWRVEKGGDPYRDDCEASTKAIGEALGVTPTIAYQSKYGKGKWLGPSLFETVKKLGAAHKPIVIANPIFTADNLETIFEIDDEVAAVYKAAGGTSLKRVPCLNANETWVKAFVEEILPTLEFKQETKDDR